MVSKMGYTCVPQFGELVIGQGFLWVDEEGRSLTIFKERLKGRNRED